MIKNSNKIKAMNNSGLMYLNDGVSFKELTEEYDLLIGWSASRNKYLRYLEHGLNGIQINSKYNRYSEEFKETVVKDFLDRKVPMEQIAIKYNIPNADTVKDWIMKYTKGEK